MFKIIHLFFFDTKWWYVKILVGDVMVADVLVELKAKEIDQTFTYKIPSNLLDKVEVGKRVLVPFGKQKLEGFVLNFE